MAGLMPAGYSDSSTGGVKYTPQDDRVDTEVSRITSAGGPLMKQAAAQGKAAAGRRGLLNSSMAVGAAQQAVLNTALPMASQNASQTAAKNLSAQEHGQTRDVNEQTYGHNRGLQEQKFGYDTSLAEQAYQNQRGITQLQGEWDSRLQGEQGDQNRRTVSLQGDINSRLQSEGAAQAQQQTQLEGNWSSRLQSEQGDQARRTSYQEYTQQQALSDQEYRQTRALTELDRTSQERIAAMNVSAHDRQYAMSALAAMEGNYSSVFNAIASNENLPAETRNAYLSHIGAIRDSTLGLVEQMYTVNLTWASPGAPSVAA